MKITYLCGRKLLTNNKPMNVNRNKWIRLVAVVALVGSVIDAQSRTLSESEARQVRAVSWCRRALRVA